MSSLILRVSPYTIICFFPRFVQFADRLSPLTGSASMRSRPSNKHQCGRDYDPPNVLCLLFYEDGSQKRRLWKNMSLITVFNLLGAIREVNTTNLFHGHVVGFGQAAVLADHVATVSTWNREPKLQRGNPWLAVGTPRRRQIVLCRPQKATKTSPLKPRLWNKPNVNS